MNKTVCLDEDVLQMWVEGTLHAAEYAIVAQHVPTCSTCQTRIVQYKQLMWDLQHPEPVPEPEEQHQLYEELMQAWRQRQADEAAAAAKQGRRLVPAWAGYSVMWTDRLPGVRLLRTAVQRSRRTGRSTRRPFGRLFGRRGGV